MVAAAVVLVLVVLSNAILTPIIHERVKTKDAPSRLNGTL